MQERTSGPGLLNRGGRADRTWHGADAHPLAVVVCAFRVLTPQGGLKPFEMAIDVIQSSKAITNEQRRDIFYNNAARFLRLSDQEIARHHGR